MEFKDLRDLQSQASPLPYYARITSGDQGLIISGANGDNVAVAYKSIDAAVLIHGANMLPKLRKALQDLRDEAQAARRHIALNEREGLDAYNATAVAIQAADEALREANNPEELN